MRDGRSVGLNTDSLTKITSALTAGSLSGASEATDIRRVEYGEAVAADQALVSVFDIAASAGNGTFVDEYEAVAYTLSFPAEYLRHITTSRPENLQIISVKGDSMNPTLFNDDVVMLDRSKQSLGYDGIFVLRLDETIHVKRIGRSSNPGVVKVISDNRTEFPEFERPIDSVDVLGKVIWVGKKL